MNWAEKELLNLINIVKNSNKPVQEIVDEFFATGWNILKDEYDRMSDEEKTALVRKLEEERQ